MEYTEEDTQIFNAFTNYSFDEDPIFNKGKAVIISNLEKKLVEEMKPINQGNEIFKFKIYYWTKKYQKHINISKYNKWLRNGRPVYEVKNTVNDEVDKILKDRISTYDFENDECFQNGISTLKEKFKDNEQNLNVALNNAKIFYLRKLIQSELMEKSTNIENVNKTETKENNININNKTEEKIEISVSNDNKDIEKEAIQEEEKENKPKYPKSFYEICEMIAKNQPIPGIRQIPNKINEGTPSKPSMKPRPKPWELKRVQENQNNNNNNNTPNDNNIIDNKDNSTTANDNTNIIEKK